MRMSRFSTVVAAGVFLAACQTTQGPDGTVSINPVSGTSGGTPTYSVFWDQSDHLKELVAAKDWEKVAALYRKESAHFDKNRDDAAVVTGLRAAGDALARRLIPALDSATKSIDAISWPAPPSAWADIKQAIVGAKSELSATSDEPIIKEASAHNPAKERLTKAIAALEKRIGDGAPDGFAAFDHAGDGEFFAIYPVVVSVPETIRAAMPALTPKLNQQSPEVVAAFLQRFGDRLGQEARQDVSASGFQTLLRREARGERPTLDTILLAYGKAKQLGIEPTRL